MFHVHLMLLNIFFMLLRTPRGTERGPNAAPGGRTRVTARPAQHQQCPADIMRVRHREETLATSL